MQLRTQNEHLRGLVDSADRRIDDLVQQVDTVRATPAASTEWEEGAQWGQWQEEGEGWGTPDGWFEGSIDDPTNVDSGEEEEEEEAY
jgi:hypothetical protein